MSFLFSVFSHLFLNSLYQVDLIFFDQIFPLAIVIYFFSVKMSNVFLIFLSKYRVVLVFSIKSCLCRPSFIFFPSKYWIYFIFSVKTSHIGTYVVFSFKISSGPCFIFFSSKYRIYFIFSVKTSNLPELFFFLNIDFFLSNLAFIDCILFIFFSVKISNIFYFFRQNIEFIYVIFL